MEIILLEKIQKLGNIGDIVTVKSGYARNFLVPKGKALYANEKNKNIFTERKEKIEKDNNEKKELATSFAKKFIDKEVLIIRAASESGQLYGSVTSKDISKVLKDEGLSVEKNQIILNKSIKYLTYENVEIILHPEVITDVRLNVARSKEEAETQSKIKKAVTAVEETPEEIISKGDKESLKKSDNSEFSNEVEKKSESEMDQIINNSEIKLTSSEEKTS